MTAPIFIGSPIYRGSTYGDKHPLSIPRVPVVTDLARVLGWLPNQQYKTSPRAKPAYLTGFHTSDYVSALSEAETTQFVSDNTRLRHRIGTMSNPVFAEMFRRPATAVGGGLLAAELVRDGGIVFNPGGGQHHGFPDFAAGFCYFNEPVLTIQRLLNQGLRSIAYVDIDAHHGDGVEMAFAGSQQVRMISVHEGGRWPFTGSLDEDGQGASFNLPVPRGFNDSEFQAVLNDLIVPLVDDFQPDAIFLQCGADAIEADPLSRLALSNFSHRSAIRALRFLSPRMIVSGGGGYNPWTVGRAWCAVWGEIVGFEMPDVLPKEAQDIQASLTWSRKTRPGEVLLTTLADAPSYGPIRPEIVAAIRTLLHRAGLR